MRRRRAGELAGPRPRLVAALGLALVLGAAYVAASRLDLFERYAAWSRAHEELQLDELAVVAVVALVAVSVVAVRRSRRNALLAEHLSNADEQYRSLFDYHPHGVFSIGLDGRFSTANAAAERLCGWSEAELRETAFADLLHPDSRDAAVEAFVGLLERQPANLDVVLLHRRGRLVQLSLTGLPIVVDDEVVGIYGIARDTTKQNAVVRELKRANLAAARASEAKAAFLANISHEIRTPLTSLLAASELLADTELDPLQSDVVATIGRAGQRLRRLVDNVLDFSKLEAGKVELELVELDVREVVEDVTAMFVHVAARRGVEVRHQVADDVPDVLVGDPARVAQVLNNLVANAVKFTPSGSVTVEVAVSEADDEDVALRFAVHDTGIGMSADQRGRLFQSFTQADPSITRRYGGTGLGLVISRNLVSLMGGSIWAAGEEGRGSTFTFRVTLRRPDLRRPDLGSPDLRHHDAEVAPAGRSVQP